MSCLAQKIRSLSEDFVHVSTRLTYVPLAPYDAGACIGAVLALLDQEGNYLPQKSTLQTPFLGPAYSDTEIESLLRQCHWSYTRCENYPAEAAREIMAGRVVGWFQGGLEFGARALGARSILGDPRKIETREHINRAVKRRENYRPFAPSVLEEHANDYFNLSINRFMSEVVQAKPLAHKSVPAVVHIGGTSRPQTVPKEWPLRSYRRLIEEFHALTGVPMVLNTSFNVKGEPIVCSPEDALRCFAASGLETLVIGPFVVRKPIVS